MRAMVVLLLIALNTARIIGQEVTDMLELPLEKHLFPEGIAIDPKSKRVFLNSLKDNKIVSIGFDGKNANETISPNEYGYLSGFGMTIKGDTLYALGNSLPKENNRSVLLLLDIRSKQLITSYTLNNSNFIYLNDIAVGKDGTVYITDSESNNIYTLNKSTDELEVFYSNDDVKHSNGIAISPDNNYLYLASYATGLRILDISSKTLINLPNNFRGIDGLKFHGNSLIAIVNARRNPEKNGIYQFSLNGKKSKIVKERKIHKFRRKDDLPTTFAIQDDVLFFIEDSQMDNFNQNTNKTIDKTKLESYRLVKLNLLKP